MATFQGTNMAQLVYAYAKLGVSPTPLLAALCEQPAALSQMLGALHMTELVQIFWSTVVAGTYKLEVHHAALASIARRLASLRAGPVLPRELVLGLVLAAEEDEDLSATRLLQASLHGL